MVLAAGLSVPGWSYLLVFGLLLLVYGSSYRTQAPLPALIARLAARGQVNARLVRGDFWQCSFARYDVVYAFLSPVPMTRLWDKAVAEMRPGSWLVSNSFAVPGRDAHTVLAVADRRGTRLYCHGIPERPDAAACI